MDFNRFNSRAAASRGVWLHLEHPSAKGFKLFNDDDPAKPCRVLLLGREAPEAAAHYTKIARARVNDTRALASKTNEELHAELVELARPLILDFENVEIDGKPATKADADWFLTLQTINGNPDEVSFVEQVLACTGKRASVLGNDSAG